MATTPNMNLVLPTVSVTVGPTFATMQNQVDETVDAHDHTFGKGVRIPPSGLDISSELAFGGNSATELQSTQFESQTTALTGLTASLYFLNGDLYAIDGDGTSVRVTENGSLSAAGTGTIAGLPSGTASAAFSASTFTFKASTNRYATMAGGPAALRRGDEDAPNAITLLPAASTATQTLTLPAALPAASAFVTVDSSGNFGYSPALSLGITRANQAAVGQQVSSGSGASATYSTAAWTTITNQSVTITTTGRPIIIACQSDGASDGNIVLADGSEILFRINVTGSATTTRGQFRLVRSALDPSDQVRVPNNSISAFYAASAGTYTFDVQVFATSGSVDIAHMQTFAYEL